ncbi:hypothetical protein GA0070607_4766 [Micromonospora coriariae]|uniref:Short chain dehydrogenase n=1 Tax=Micromonospora coriariae TaxID=285665 RepID=A0A1C4X6W4_9ACTN|nr:hypothetical protein GA0070607_4766 [Micromonospora coriariae]
MRATLDRFGQLDVLVNNAGRAVVGAVEEVSDAQLRERPCNAVAGDLLSIEVEAGIRAPRRPTSPFSKRRGIPTWRRRWTRTAGNREESARSHLSRCR